MLLTNNKNYDILYLLSNVGNLTHGLMRIPFLTADVYLPPCQEEDVMDNTQNEITFSQLFAVLKKSILRAVIYVAVCCAVALAVLIITRQFTRSTSYDSVIKCETEDSALLKVFYENKGDIVKKAVGAVLADGTNIDAISAKIYAITSISTVDTSTTDGETDTAPPSYLISLDPNGDLDLSDNQYKNILDGIIEEFKALLDEHNKKVVDEKTDVSTTVKISDYDVVQSLKTQQTVQVAGTLALRAGTLSSSMEMLLNAISLNKTSEYEKIEMALEQLLNDLTTLRSEIDDIEIYILNNGVGEIDKLRAYLEMSKSKAEIDSNRYKEIYEINLKLAENYPVSYNDSIQNADSYMNIVEKVNNALTKKLEADRMLQLYKNVVIPSISNTAQEETIKGQIVECGSNFSSVLEKYNRIVKEYNEEKYNKTAAEITSYAQENIYNPISNSVIFVSLIAVAFVAFAVAYVQKYGAMKKSGFLTAQKSE